MCKAVSYDVEVTHTSRDGFSFYHARTSRISLSVGLYRYIYFIWFETIRSRAGASLKSIFGCMSFRRTTERAFMVQKSFLKLAPRGRARRPGTALPSAVGGTLRPGGVHILYTGFTIYYVTRAFSPLCDVKHPRMRHTACAHTRMHTLRAIPYTHTALRPHSCRVRYGD